MSEAINIVPVKKETWLRRMWGRLRTRSPLVIVPYRGYANPSRLFLKGRILKDKGISMARTESTVRNLINTFKRFESDEVPGVKVRLQVAGNEYEVITDKEGYFNIDEPWTPPGAVENGWVEGKVELRDGPGHLPLPPPVKVEILYPDEDVRTGIISDIDDTILRTHVTSRFFWKMLYVTFFKNAHQRRPVRGMVKLLQSMTAGSGDRPAKPIFYVSDSPWNIYDLLTQFMQIQQLPKGPVILRDYGIFPTSRPKEYRGHKLYNIGRIIKTYPNLEFILFGDTGGKDTDIYLALARAFPNQIKRIYIRQTRNTPNARRVARLIREAEDVDIRLVREMEEVLGELKIEN